MPFCDIRKFCTTLFSHLKIAIFWCIAPIKFLTTSLIWHIHCVDKIGSADRGILCVDKIGSPEIPQDPCSPDCCSPDCCLPDCCSPLIRRDCLPARIRGWAGTATGPHSHVVHISHTPTERAHTDPKIISFGKKVLTTYFSTFFNRIMHRWNFLSLFCEARLKQSQWKSRKNSQNFAVYSSKIPSSRIF